MGVESRIGRQQEREPEPRRDPLQEQALEHRTNLPQQGREQEHRKGRQEQGQGLDSRRRNLQRPEQVPQELEHRTDHRQLERVPEQHRTDHRQLEQVPEHRIGCQQERGPELRTDRPVPEQEPRVPGRQIHQRLELEPLGHQRDPPQQVRELRVPEHRTNLPQQGREQEHRKGRQEQGLGLDSRRRNLQRPEQVPQELEHRTDHRQLERVPEQHRIDHRQQEQVPEHRIGRQQERGLGHRIHQRQGPGLELLQRPGLEPPGHQKRR